MSYGGSLLPICTAVAARERGWERGREGLGERGEKDGEIRRSTGLYNLILGSRKSNFLIMSAHDDLARCIGAGDH